jgi:hypothetical protein
MIKKITACRNCKKKKLEILFNLGNLSYTGKFPKKFSTNVPKVKIILVKCRNCHLVQLDRNFNPKYLYGKDYGYRSGINKTMSHHLKNTALYLSKKANIKKGDYVLDIASNDGTLLNSYNSGVIKVGVDPLIYKFKNYYKKINFPINSFFSYEEIKKKIIKNKFKIITALSVFYDLKDPNKFLNDISKIIDQKNGIFLLEHTDLHSILKNNLFDTICHEHLEYYSTEVIINMALKNNLKVFSVRENDINGGSKRFLICHSNANYPVDQKLLSKYINLENQLGIKSKICYKLFFNKIIYLKNNLNKIINNLKKANKTIHGYGASTKGNVLLQFYNLNREQIPLIADRNPKKNNCYTPGTKIKIISEEKSRSLKPDYYLVLPWHFKKEILIREKKIMKSGTKFIFPLPKITIQ